MKREPENESRSQSLLEATAWADGDEQFQCLRDAVSRAAQVLRRSLRGPGRNKRLHGSCWSGSTAYRMH